MSVLRDIFRRKGRSILTITGIGVGVFALVVLGAVAENMSVLLASSGSYYDNVITVVESKNSNFVGMSLGSRPLAKEIVDEIRAYPGVREVEPAGQHPDLRRVHRHPADDPGRARPTAPTTPASSSPRAARCRPASAASRFSAPTSPRSAASSSATPPRCAA